MAEALRPAYVRDGCCSRRHRRPAGASAGDGVRHSFSWSPRRRACTLRSVGDPRKDIRMRRREGTTRISGMSGLFVLFITAFFSSASAQVPAVDSRNVNLRRVETHAVLRKYQSLLEWQRRKAFLRDQILVSAGLSPMPTKTPLHAQVFGRIEGETYTIEKVLLETLPGFYLGGNL